jgi:hypothetical protein
MEWKIILFHAWRVEQFSLVFFWISNIANVKLIKKTFIFLASVSEIYVTNVINTATKTAHNSIEENSQHVLRKWIFNLVDTHNTTSTQIITKCGLQSQKLIQLEWLQCGIPFQLQAVSFSLLSFISFCFFTCNTVLR